MPIRSPRQLYRLNTIKVGEAANGTGGSPIIVKMKESIGDWLGMQPLAYNDSALTGTFGTGGTNAGYKYRRRLGGFRHGSYTLVAKTTFRINELIRQDDGTYDVDDKNFRTISIGFPAGHSVHEFITWLATTNRINEVSAIITPRGARVSIAPAT